MAIQNVEMSIHDICNMIKNDEIAKIITESILHLFVENGLTYKTRTDLLYCFIKKSKEALIINTKGYKFGAYELQLRIKDSSIFDKLDDFSENVRNKILHGNKDCCAPRCCNCGSAYIFNYHNNTYRKCHMLCDNFYFYGLENEDIDSLISIIKNEIIFNMPKNKRVYITNET